VATKFVIIVRGGTDYNQLRRQMMSLSDKSGWEVDTLGRGFIQETGQIALPINHEDELYAGHYFHKRYDTESLSVEYLSAYQESANSDILALVAGIYSDRSTAQEALKRLKRYEPEAYLLESQLYMGCAH